MKKSILTAVSAAFAASAALAALDSTSFEWAAGPLADNDNQSWNYDASVFSGEAGSDWSKVVAYGEGDLAPTNTAGEKYLQVNNSSPLTRWVDVEGASHNNKEIGTGLFVDMWVRFTPSDLLPDIASTDKISVWMAGDSAGHTNLVVSAGELVASSTGIDAVQQSAVHYAVSVDGFSPDDGWHRLVIKSYSTVNEGKVLPTFLVFVDGNPATITGRLDFVDDVITVDSTTAAVCTDNTDDALATLVTGLAPLDSSLAAHQLFPSFIPGDLTGTAVLSAVGYVGMGCVDLHTVTDVDPLAQNYSTASLVIALSDSNGGTLSATTISDLAPGAEATFTFTLASGYNLVGAMFNGGAVTVNTDGNSTTVTMPDPLTVPSYTLTINVAPYLATVGGVGYDALDEAVAAAASSGNPVLLCSDVELVTDGDPALTIGQGANVTIDLCGHSISVMPIGTDAETIEGLDGSYGIEVVGSLTITDSSSGQTGTLSAASLASYDGGSELDGLYILSNGGTLTIQGGTFNSEIMSSGTLSITQGRFHLGAFTDGDPDNGGTFALAGYIASGVGDATKSGNYWVVGNVTPSDTFPPEWNNNHGADVSQAIKDKFATWSQQYDPDGDNAEQAFLLNVAPAETLTLDATAITVDANGKVTITANKDLSGVNGVVYVLTGTALDDITTPVAVEEDVLDITGGEGTSLLELAPGATVAPVKFFKIGVGYAVPAAQSND